MIDSYFKKLFAASVTDWTEVISCVSNYITAEENENLIRHVEGVEVEMTLFHMYSDKSLGPHSMSHGFIRNTGTGVLLVKIWSNWFRIFLRLVRSMIILHIKILC